MHQRLRHAGGEALIPGLRAQLVGRQVGRRFTPRCRRPRCWPRCRRCCWRCCRLRRGRWRIGRFAGRHIRPHPLPARAEHEARICRAPGCCRRRGRCGRLRGRQRRSRCRGSRGRARRWSRWSRSWRRWRHLLRRRWRRGFQTGGGRHRGGRRRRHRALRRWRLRLGWRLSPRRWHHQGWRCRAWLRRRGRRDNNTGAGRALGGRRLPAGRPLVASPRAVWVVDRDEIWRGRRLPGRHRRASRGRAGGLRRGRWGGAPAAVRRLDETGRCGIEVAAVRHYWLAGCGARPSSAGNHLLVGSAVWAMRSAAVFCALLSPDVQSDDGR